MPNQKFLFAAIIWWSILDVGNARAATITETVPFTIQAPFAGNQAAGTLHVLTPQFNPALGTLQSGTTTITGSTSIALEFFDTMAGGAYDVLVSDTLTVGGIPGLFVEELTGVLPANQATFITPGANFPFGPVDRSDPAVVVVGSGTWDQVFSLPFPSLTVKLGPTTIIPGIVINGSSVTTYTYTPAMAPAPEPRWAGVLALFFASALVVRNWRRKTNVRG